LPLESDPSHPPAPQPSAEQDVQVVRSLTSLLPYAIAVHNPTGDTIRGIAFCKWILRSPQATKEQKILALRFLVHLVGDLMQPLHVGNGLDSGGNSCLVKWRGKEQIFYFTRVADLSFHAVWDDLLINEKKCPRGRGSSVMIACSHVQWSKILSDKFDDNLEQAKRWSGGDTLDWAIESAGLRDRIYPVMKNAEGRPLEVVYKDRQSRELPDRKGFHGRPYFRPKTPKGAPAAQIESSYKPDLGEDYFRQWEPTLDQQLYKGGLRLARVLNEIFKEVER